MSSKKLSLHMSLAEQINSHKWYFSFKVGCRFHNLEMCRLLNVAAKSKNDLESAQVEAHFRILEDFWKATHFFPWSPNGSRTLGALPGLCILGLDSAPPCSLEAKSLGAVSLLRTLGPWSTEMLFPFLSRK